MRCFLLGLAAWVGISFCARAQKISDYTFEGVRFTLCEVDLARTKLQIFHENEKGERIKRLAALDAYIEGKGETLLFATNAGMYHGDFSPVGLYVENGKEKFPINLKEDKGNFFWKPNAVFAVKGKRAVVVDSERYAKSGAKPDLATQSGPALVLDAVIHRGFRKSHRFQLIRNGVGVTKNPSQVYFLISEDPVDLNTLARAFRDGLGCVNALYFDGTISSWYIKGRERVDFRMDLGPMIGITRKNHSADPVQ